MTVEELMNRLRQVPDLDSEVVLFATSGDITTDKGSMIAGAITDVEFDINLGKCVIASCTCGEDEKMALDNIWKAVDQVYGDR